MNQEPRKPSLAVPIIILLQIILIVLAGYSIKTTPQIIEKQIINNQPTELDCPIDLEVCSRDYAPVPIEENLFKSLFKKAESRDESYGVDMCYKQQKEGGISMGWTIPIGSIVCAKKYNGIERELKIGNIIIFHCYEDMKGGGLVSYEKNESIIHRIIGFEPEHAITKGDHPYQNGREYVPFDCIDYIVGSVKY